MEIKFSKNSIKFLNKLPSKNKEQIREKILYLLNSLENQKFIPFQELDIKNSKVIGKGFLECVWVKLE